MKRAKYLGLFLVILSFSLAAAGWAATSVGPSIGDTDIITRPPIVITSTPPAPSDLKADCFPGALYVGLRWEDNSINETGFTIERSAEGGDFLNLTTVDANVKEYVDYDVIRDTAYSYRVRANGPISNSAYSNVAEWTTGPNNPTNLTAVVDELAQHIDLNWDGNNKHAFYVIQKTTYAEQTKIEQISLTGESTRYEDTAVLPNIKYTYMVMAGSANDYSDGSNVVSVKFMPQPTGVFVSYFPGTTGFAVQWTDNCNYETGYVLEKAFAGNDYVYTYNLPANTVQYLENPLDLDEHYMFRVKAIGPDGQKSPYSEVCHWFSPPHEPINLVLKAESSSTVKITWEDRSKIETSYKIWRHGLNEYLPIALPADSSSYTDTGLKPGTEYEYTIYAYNDTSKTRSADLPYFKVTTPAATPLAPGNLTIKEGVLQNLKLQTVLQIGSPNMTINGVTQEIDPGKGTSPVIMEGRTLLPVRAIIESMGGTVGWDAAEKKVTVTCGDKTVLMWIGSLNTMVNGEAKTTDVAPVIINGRTMLPVRFISENLGLDVEWKAETNSVIIKTGS
ncbi:stalk domain-containing protein [Pelotomaculum propionicicum]|uniref:stalk domain-containing protein n=1 Tax=Pelotomaculum propionicicum TaxID=258475 RepID=UPI003B7CC2BD